MACGTCGNQYNNAPIAGNLMASLVQYCEGGSDHDNDPLQFELPYINKSINTDFLFQKATNQYGVQFRCSRVNITPYIDSGYYFNIAVPPRLKENQFSLQVSDLTSRQPNDEQLPDTRSVLILPSNRDSMGDF